MSKRKAQIWDQIEYFGEDYNNYQMYAVLEIDGRLDKALLKRAGILCFDIFPVLRSKYVEGPFRAYWQEFDHNSTPEFFYFIENPVEAEAETIPAGLSTDAHKGPQVLIRLARYMSNDRLCIVMNHMICDAAGFKQYLYTLADVYSRLCVDPGYIPGYQFDGSRSGMEVYRGFIRNAKGFAAKAAALFQFQHYRNFRNEISFPGEGEDNPFIASLALSSERFRELKAYCRDMGVTINDVFLSAFYRAVAQQFPGSADRLTIPFMIDLRRLLPNGSPGALSNLTSTIRLRLGADIGESADDTVAIVHHEVCRQIENMDVMNGYLHLMLFFCFLPYPAFRWVIDKFFRSFPIAFSNLGIIEDNWLHFGETVLKDCFMTGSIKKKPCFWYAMSSFNGRITMTINLDGTEADRSFIEGFLKTVEQQLPV